MKKKSSDALYPLAGKLCVVVFSLDTAASNKAFFFLFFLISSRGWNVFSPNLVLCERNKGIIVESPCVYMVNENISIFSLLGFVSFGSCERSQGDFFFICCCCYILSHLLLSFVSLVTASLVRGQFFLRHFQSWGRGLGHV